MRMILQIFPNSTNECQCILFRDGKYSVVTYRSNGRVSKYNVIPSVDDINNTFRDYDDLLICANESLLRKL